MGIGTYRSGPNQTHCRLGVSGTHHSQHNSRPKHLAIVVDIQAQDNTGLSGQCPVDTITLLFSVLKLPGLREPAS